MAFAMITLFGFLFTSWWSALAVAGVVTAVPIIIHLLNRKRFRIVTWAAMRFLLLAQQQTRRRLRIEQLLLLLLRILMVLMLILAMISVTSWGESFWNSVLPDWVLEAVSVDTGRTHRIIVIDGSYSMALQEKGQTQFDKAKEMAEKIVQRAKPGDGF